MIIFGYAGIGKSTLANKANNYIDLESSLFRTSINPNRSNDWYEAYGNIAHDLSSQGFHVFCSMHEDTRKYIIDKWPDEKIVYVYPSINLKDEWIKKLEDRFKQTGRTKDDAALRYVANNYDDSIIDFKSKEGIHVEIDNINYDLETCLQPFKEV